MPAIDYRLPASHSGRRQRYAHGGNRRRLPRGGFTIVELMTVMGVIGTLAALVLPAVGSAREAARRMQCQNQLRQIGMALHGYHDQHQSLPIGWLWESSGQSAYGWSVALLPFVEQQELYYRIDRNKTLQQPVNDEARQTAIALFRCPSDITTATFSLYAGTPSIDPLLVLPSANYLGVFGNSEADDCIPAPRGNGSFLESASVRFADLERGLSSTLLVGERTMARIPSTWLGVDYRGEDAACRLVGSAMTAPNCKYCDECEFDSRHVGGAMFVWADGHAGLVSENIDTAEYRRLVLRSEY